MFVQMSFSYKRERARESDKEREREKKRVIVGFLEDNNHIPRGVSGGKHEILGTGVVFDAE